MGHLIRFLVLTSLLGLALSLPRASLKAQDGVCQSGQRYAVVVDNDCDDVLNDFDACPQQAGDKSNNGCPLNIGPDGQPLVDRDGDSVGDLLDVCPDNAGYPQWGGCPDEDGDGLTTQYDACPAQNGPRENNGCPLPTGAVVTPIPNTGNSNSSALPTTGPCVITPRGRRAINIRSTPSTRASIVGTLQPAEVVAVIGRRNQSDGVWYQIEAGWVKGTVVRTGGASCANP